MQICCDLERRDISPSRSTDRKQQAVRETVLVVLKWNPAQGSYNCFRLPQKRFSGVDHLIRFPGIGQITRGEVESISDY